MLKSSSRFLSSAAATAASSLGGNPSPAGHDVDGTPHVDRFRLRSPRQFGRRSHHHHHDDHDDAPRFDIALKPNGPHQNAGMVPFHLRLPLPLSHDGLPLAHLSRSIPARSSLQGRSSLHRPPRRIPIGGPHDAVPGDQVARAVEHQDRTRELLEPGPVRGGGGGGDGDAGVGGFGVEGLVGREQGGLCGGDVGHFDGEAGRGGTRRRRRSRWEQDRDPERPRRNTRFDPPPTPIVRL
mmetsp:Transcript_12239/g.24813  ORF Transcript_12239/g.24813 Transcript_12239/m.24813 type:complete len:238 (+) Transcript_12239:111-824(+)